MNFFASKLRNKSPAELVRLLRDNTIKLEAGYAANNNMEVRKVRLPVSLGLGRELIGRLALGFQASEEISKSLSAMKSILNGEAGGEAVKKNRMIPSRKDYISNQYMVFFLIRSGLTWRYHSARKRSLFSRCPQASHSQHAEVRL